MKKIFQQLGKLIESRFQREQKRLCETRGAYNQKQFVDHFNSLGFDSKISIETWEALQKEAVIDGFKPKPEDDLLGVFGLADEDLDDVVLALLERCQCRVPPPPETAQMAPVKTVADLVQFVASMRR